MLLNSIPPSVNMPTLLFYLQESTVPMPCTAMSLELLAGYRAATKFLIWTPPEPTTSIFVLCFLGRILFWLKTAIPLVPPVCTYFSMTVFLETHMAPFEGILSALFGNRRTFGLKQTKPWPPPNPPGPTFGPRGPPWLTGPVKRRRPRKTLLPILTDKPRGEPSPKASAPWSIRGATLQERGCTWVALTLLPRVAIDILILLLKLKQSTEVSPIRRWVLPILLIPMGQAVTARYPLFGRCIPMAKLLPNLVLRGVGQATNRPRVLTARVNLSNKLETRTSPSSPTGNSTTAAPSRNMPLMGRLSSRVNETRVNQASPGP